MYVIYVFVKVSLQIINVKGVSRCATSKTRQSRKVIKAILQGEYTQLRRDFTCFGKNLVIKRILIFIIWQPTKNGWKLICNTFTQEFWLIDCNFVISTSIDMTTWSKVHFAKSTHGYSNAFSGLGCSYRLIHVYTVWTGRPVTN